MPQTNIDRFDEVAAKILATMYERFPEPIGLNPSVIGMTTEKPERDEIGGFKYSPAWLELDLFIHWTAQWLSQEGREFR